MKKIIYILMIAFLVTGCRSDVDMKNIFFNDQELFKKIENPIITTKRYVFEKSTFSSKDSIFSPIYLANIENIFLKTKCDIVYVGDGDILIGCKKNLTKLFYTNKSIDVSVELLNFRGKLSYLLLNGNLNREPLAISIAPNWYVVRDINSL